MQALWTEPRVTFHGEFWQLENAAMEPKPFQKPYPPLWFGGASEPAGAELILFTALFDQREQMEQLAAAVLPKLG